MKSTKGRIKWDQMSIKGLIAVFSVLVKGKKKSYRGRLTSVHFIFFLLDLIIVYSMAIIGGRDSCLK